MRFVHAVSSHPQGFCKCIESLRDCFIEKEGIQKKYRLQVDVDRHHYFSERLQRKRREEKDLRARKEKKEKQRQAEDVQYIKDATEHLRSSLAEMDSFFASPQSTDIIIPSSLQSTYRQLQTVSLQTRSSARDALSQMRHLRHELHRLQREASSRAENQRRTEIAALLDQISRLRSLHPMFRWMNEQLELAGKELPVARTAGEVAGWREKLNEVEEGIALAEEMTQLLEGSAGGKWREAFHRMFDEGCERCGSFAEMKGM